MIIIRRQLRFWNGQAQGKKKRKKSPSKLDAEYDQDIGVSNIFALISVWRNDFNNEDEETINKEEESAEDLVEEAAI